MTTKLKKNLFTGVLATSIVLFGTTLAGFCYNGVTLSAVNIEGISDTFQITLKTNSDTEVKTSVPSTNKLIIELDNTIAADLIKTSFSNANNIDDVIVQPIGKNKTRLFISGKNVSASKIIIDSTKQPVVADRFSEDRSYSVLSRNKKAEIVNDIKENKVVSSKDFIEENYEEQQQAEEVIAEEPVNASNVEHPEITGVVSHPPVEEPAIIETETTVSSDQDDLLEPEFLQPAADLELAEDVPVATTKAKTSNESAAVSASQSFSDSSNAVSSIFSTDSLIRFGIVFLFMIILVAYIRKEGLLSGKKKSSGSKQIITRDMDLYRSLNGTAKTPNGYNKRSKVQAKPSSLDSVINARKPVSNARSAKRFNTSSGKALNLHTAIQGYNTQQKTGQKPLVNRAAAANRSKNPAGISGRRNLSQPVSGKPKTADTIQFLQQMAEEYRKDGRHDLAQNIQNNIRKNLAKA